MSPPRASSADSAQSPEQIVQAITSYIAENPTAAILEDGRVLFDLTTAQHELRITGRNVTLQLWSDEANITRRITAAMPRAGTLRLDSWRFGQAQSKLLELVPTRTSRTPTTRDTARQRYIKLLERALPRAFPDYTPEAFRSSMDLEKSFGPAYARGTLLRGNQAWAVIGVSEHESPATIDGILTLGILWLHDCRERSAGKRLIQGLKVIVPQGTAQLTAARMAWLNRSTAKWELYELDARTEELSPRDITDQGNIRSALIHHVDPTNARERFAEAIEDITSLIPAHEASRVEHRLRSTHELAFLLHGFEFARARIRTSNENFNRVVHLTIGAEPEAQSLSRENREALKSTLADLFARRRPFIPATDYGRRATHEHIGSAANTRPAHSRLEIASPPRARHQNPAKDPLYRAQPERWLESVLFRDLSSLNRVAEPTPPIIPRLDAHHVYSQVPAIVGASDRGLLDLLGVTADGRLAVIELKADDDLHFALQGLDYWVRIRHHHAQPLDHTGCNTFHQHGYFRGVELSTLPPRLYLIAPALHIHPATETVLRYLAPQVEWQLLALDERWRQQIRVVWRKQNKQ